ncbi:MAG: ABC transporter permease subunit [Dehalococcoidia bacterium]|nr:ABC transporter permease subunit [Dehalococcoidia bacterium]
MAIYALKRLLWLIPVLLFISIVTFGLMHAVEGGPWDEDRSVPAAVTENLNRKYGLDKPVWRQYINFVTNAVQGDLGVSYQRQDKPVTDIILSGFRVTAVLGLMALLLATAAGVSLGVMSALNRNRLPDYAGVLFASLGSALPAFVLGIFLIYLFGVKLQLLPTFGWDVRRGLIPGWLPPIEQMVLPVITLAALPAAYLARVTRASLLDVLRQDYIRTAHAKGLSRTAVLTRHSLRNAAIPVLTVIGPITAGLVTGSFIIEQLFSVPGTGRLFVQSVTARDYGLIMGTTLFYATVIVVANLAVDLAYAFIDPRIRYR